MGITHAHGATLMDVTASSLDDHYGHELEDDSPKRQSWRAGFAVSGRKWVGNGQMATEVSAALLCTSHSFVHLSDIICLCARTPAGAHCAFQWPPLHGVRGYGFPNSHDSTPSIVTFKNQLTVKCAFTLHLKTVAASALHSLPRQLTSWSVSPTSARRT